MTIHLPPEIERSIQAAVHSGDFASVDDALAEAWRSFQQHRQPPAPTSQQGSIGALRDDADLPGQAAQPPKPIWEVVDDLRKGIPPGEFAKLPKDGAEQLDHYLYGSPKRPTA
jgi:Arc/MetJ-type ribon-helix-helix transcriptional regulator